MPRAAINPFIRDFVDRKVENGVYGSGRISVSQRDDNQRIHFDGDFVGETSTYHDDDCVIFNGMFIHTNRTRAAVYLTEILSAYRIVMQ